jgi:BirA family biotin operon repressor/biotin-[acetyl-CoA-carboxylase] ligase
LLSIGNLVGSNVFNILSVLGSAILITVPHLSDRVIRQMKTDRDSDRLNPDIITGILGSSIFSKNVVFRERLASTNALAKYLALKGAPEGTIVLTEEQTAGKGRMDRRWLSPAYKNLLFSVLLRPGLSVDKVFTLTMILGLAIIGEIKAKNRLDVMIKWPNDLCINQKKVGGILTEFSIRDKRLEYVILGLGLNVNWMPEKGDGLIYPATSILVESGRMISRNRLFSGILKRFEGYYQEVLSGKDGRLYKRWNHLSAVIGRDVEIISQDNIITGKVLKIDRQGALILKDDQGEERRILSGDVSLRME